MDKTKTQLEKNIAAAQCGDGAAYGRLIEQFQDMAFFSALRYLGSAPDAEDAAQNAFIEAYRCLPTLREPLAFPAWFKRIVRKQCDRISRRRLPLQLDETAWQLFGDFRDTPEQMVMQLQQREAVRRGLGTLPNLYRDVATQFYFQNHSVNEIANQLDLSVSTVKKRLFTARQKLKETLKPMSTAKTPSQDNSFSNRVRFFIALQNNDLIQLRQLLRRDPDLLTMQTEWNKGAASWYMPLGTTAIHLAAGNGNLPMLRLLLEEGVDVEISDHAGRTALYHATHMGYSDAVHWLLEQGANPNQAAHNGQTPLHAAVIRNWPKVVALLQEHRVETAVVDSQGRTPLDWARLKALSNIARLLGDESALDLPDSPAPSVDASVWETGIKILDLIAPLKWGGRNGLLCPISGIGVDVMLGELIHRMATIFDGKTVQVGLSHGGFDAESRMQQWRNLGIAKHVELFFGEYSNSESKRAHIIQRATGRVQTLAASGPVLFIIYNHIGLTSDVMDALKSLDDLKSVTLLFVGSESIGAEPSPLANLDAAFTFDYLRAGEGWWPALDLTRSFSKHFRSEVHKGAARAAVRTAKRYSDLHFIFKKQGLDGIDLGLYDGKLRTDVLRSRRMHIYLNQPLFVAEPWSATPGQFVPLSETIETVQHILDGDFDETPEEEISRIGEWSPRWT